MRFANLPILFYFSLFMQFGTNLQPVKLLNRDVLFEAINKADTTLVVIYGLQLLLISGSVSSYRGTTLKKL